MQLRAFALDVRTNEMHEEYHVLAYSETEAHERALANSTTDNYHLMTHFTRAANPTDAPRVDIREYEPEAIEVEVPVHWSQAATASEALALVDAFSVADNLGNPALALLAQNATPPNSDGFFTVHATVYYTREPAHQEHALALVRHLREAWSTNLEDPNEE